MSNIFDKKQLRLIRKHYLMAILWVLIIELIVWVAVILLSDSIYNPIIGKIQTMFLAFVACALINVGSFKCMELGDSKSRAFAITSLVTAIVAVILDLLLIWEIVPTFTETIQFGNNNFSVLTKITLSTMLTSIASLVEANIFIYVKPSKLARNISAGVTAFIYVCFIIAIIGIDLTDKLHLLVVVVPFASFLIYLVANRIAKLEEVSSNKIISEIAANEQAKRQAKPSSTNPPTPTNPISTSNPQAGVNSQSAQSAATAQPPIQPNNVPPTTPINPTPPHPKQDY